MNYEERYKKALERARIGLHDCNLLDCDNMTRRAAITTIYHLFPELAEDKDEQIRKGIIRNLQYLMDRSEGFVKEDLQERIAWLEKQGEHANFRNKIQVGDKVTRNEDGVLVNLSQLNRVAKKDEKQGKQKYADTEKGAKGNEREIPISAWSEEDETRFESCIKVLQASDGYDTINTKWLKSLKDRYTWMPSDEQMHYLSWIANVKLGDSVVEQEVSKHLNKLYEDLKKLKGK